jgi:phage-related protein
VQIIDIDNMLNATYYNNKRKRINNVRDFLDSLEPKLLAKTLRTIDLLETNGPQLREPYSKILENGIFELRTKQSSDITRVLYFFISGQKAVLTNGFIKKSQKTPKAELDLAKKYKADYERRYSDE